MATFAFIFLLVIIVVIGISLWRHQPNYGFVIRDERIWCVTSAKEIRNNSWDGSFFDGCYSTGMECIETKEYRHEIVPPSHFFNSAAECEYYLKSKADKAEKERLSKEAKEKEEKELYLEKRRQGIALIKKQREECSHDFLYDKSFDSRARRFCHKCNLKQVSGTSDGDTDKWFNSLFAVLWCTNSRLMEWSKEEIKLPI